MASEKDKCDDSIRIDQNALLGEMENFAGATRHIKAAGYGLAAPLSALRLSQMRAEKARAVARFGEKSDTAAARTAQLQTATVRADALNAEFTRTLVDPPRPDIKRNQAGIHGRVVEAGAPKPDLIVGALDDQEQWQGHTCTGPRGDFAFSSTANTSLRLIVTDKAGVPLYRDPTERTYAPGQVVWREIDLAITEKPCDDRQGGGGEEVEPKLVVVPELVGLDELDALERLKEAGLVRGERSTVSNDESAGRVIEQVPESGAEVERGSAVAIVVGISTEIRMPHLVGVPVDIAREELTKIPHAAIEIEQQPDPDRVGIVLAQLPPRDTVMSDDVTVLLTVGVSDRLVMPSLINEKLEQAMQTLEALGITNIEVAEVPDPQRIGLVIEHKPERGAEIDEDTEVTLVVGVRRELEDSPERFRNVFERVVTDDRFDRLDIGGDSLERTLMDRDLNTTSELRRLSDAEARDIRTELDLPTLNAAKTLRIVLRAALKAADQE